MGLTRVHAGCVLQSGLSVGVIAALIELTLNHFLYTDGVLSFYVVYFLLGFILGYLNVFNLFF